MPKPTDALMLQFLDWLAASPRTYAEAMEAWRTTCPRLTIWEDALAAGLIEIRHRRTREESMVGVTERGREVLSRSRSGTPR